MVNNVKGEKKVERRGGGGQRWVSPFVRWHHILFLQRKGTQRLLPGIEHGRKKKRRGEKQIPGDQLSRQTHLLIPCLSDLNILTAANKARITWLSSGAWSKCAQIAQAGAGKEWKVNHLQLPPLQALVTYLSTEQSVTWSKGPHFQTAFSVGEAVSSPSVFNYR